MHRIAGVLLGLISVACILFSFYRDVDIVVAVAPLGALLLLPLLRPLNNPRRIFVAFWAFLWIIDDPSTVPWPNMPTITKTIATVFYRLLPVIPLEYFPVGLLAFLVMQQRGQVFSRALFTTVLVSSLILVADLGGAIVGASTGWKMGTFFIQIRFHHLIMLWAIVGSFMMPTPQMANSMLKITMAAIAFKGMQGLFNFLVHHNIFTGPDRGYLIDHPFSAFLAMGLFYYGFDLFNAFKARNLRKAAMDVIILVPMLVSFIVNDRRTSVVALAFSVCTLPLIFDTRMVIKFLLRRAKPVMAGVIFLALSVGMPPPIGFIGAKLRSAAADAGPNQPSSREKENYNTFLNLFKSPIAGIGLGKPLADLAPMDALSVNGQGYDRDSIIPHNTMLAFWAFSGAFGMALLSTFYSIFFALAIKLFVRARDSMTRLQGLLTFVFVWEMAFYTTADMGLQWTKILLYAGMALGSTINLLEYNRKHLRAKGEAPAGSAAGVASDSAVQLPAYATK